MSKFVATKNNQLVNRYGILWARNQKNLQSLRSIGKLYGVYVLCDGSMPVYIGRGRLISRIMRHQRSKSRGQYWDHFSWFEIPNRQIEADVEALLLQMLPFYLRSLNKQKAKFIAGHKEKEKNPEAAPIKRPNFAAKRKRK